MKKIKFLIIISGMLGGVCTANATIFSCVNKTKISLLYSISCGNCAVSAQGQEVVNVCATNKVTTTGQIASGDLKHGAGQPGTSLYCWCRLTRPLVSNWVGVVLPSGTNCLASCGEYCADAFKSSPTFKSSILTPMTTNTYGN